MPQPTVTGSHRPRIIIHGGAGSITRANLPPNEWAAHKRALTSILHSTQKLLESPSTTALEAASNAVVLLESDPLFNAGRGAVFTRTGTIELEASVMVSRGMRKRGASVALLKHVRSPVALAAKMLRNGEREDGGGAARHQMLAGREAEELASAWGLDVCEQSFFWTRKRWEEHRRGLRRFCNDEESEKSEHLSTLPADGEHVRPDGCAWSSDDPSWDGETYLPQGTVGCVVLDASGVLAVATSTGGITNKLPGRIGDTPSFGAGFWADEWSLASAHQAPSLLSQLQTMPVVTAVVDCLPLLTSVWPATIPTGKHAVAMSGTGNGDSFLRIAAVHTAASRARFGPAQSLAESVSWLAGRGGELQRSAGQFFAKGEGQGGIIGIQVKNGKSKVVFDFNCGGLFRCWVDDNNTEHCMVFHEPY